MKPLSNDTYLARWLARLAATVCRHPRWFFWPQLALWVACVVYTVFFLQFDTSRDDLVDAKAADHQNYLRLKAEFPQQSDLVVVIESENVEKNRQFAERIGAKLEAETNLFTDIFYKADLGNLKQTLHDDLPFLQKFTQTTNLVSFIEQINTAFRTASRETNAQTE